MPAYPTVKQSFGLLGLTILLMVVFAFPYVSLTQSIGRDPAFFFYYILTTGGGVFIGITLRGKAGDNTTFDFSMRNKATIPLILVTLAGIVYGLETPLVSLIPISDSFKRMLMEIYGDLGVFSFLAIVVAAPIAEELLFRGIILDGFLRRYGPMKSIVVSSVLFGLIHMNPWQFVTATLLGGFMGWVYYRTRSVAMTIMIHLANNLMSFVTMMFTDPENMFDTSLVETYGSVLMAISVTGVAICVAVYGIFQLDKMFGAQVLIAEPAPVDVVSDAIDSTLYKETTDDPHHHDDVND